MFLRREYIPFLPTTESEPRGPIDPPLLEAVAPTGWWEANSKELFDAGECITNILQELEDCDAALITPFAGFCAFSASIQNFYVSKFPRMNLGRSTKAATLARKNKSYLYRFKDLWPIGEGWVSATAALDIFSLAGFPKLILMVLVQNASIHRNPSNTVHHESSRVPRKNSRRLCSSRSINE